MSLVSKCVVCRQDIDINFSLARSTGKRKVDKAKENCNDEEEDESLFDQEKNDRLVFQTFCKYFNLSSRRWERLWSEFYGNGGSCPPRKKRKVQGKNRTSKDKNNRRINGTHHDDVEDEPIDIPAPFCNDCKSVVASLCDLDKMCLMVRSEISKLVAGILNIILSNKDNNNTQVDFLKVQNRDNNNAHVDVDQILACEIVRLRNSVFQQYTPKLIINDCLKYKNPAVQASPASQVGKNLPSLNKRRKIATKVIIKDEIEISPPVNEQPSPLATTLLTNSNSHSSQELDCNDYDDSYDNFEPPSPTAQVNSDDFNEAKIILESEDQKDILANNSDNESEIEVTASNKLDDEEIIATNSPRPIYSKVMNVDLNLVKVEPCTLDITSSIEPEPQSSNDTNSPRKSKRDGPSSCRKNKNRNIKNSEGEPVEWQCGSCPFSTNSLDELSTHTQHRHRDVEPQAESSSSTNSPRKAKKDALVKIKQKVEELRSFDVVIDVTKSREQAPPPSHVLDEIVLDSDGELVDVNDDDDDDSEYNSHSENAEDHEEDESQPIQNPKRGRPAGSLNRPKSTSVSPLKASANTDKRKPERVHTGRKQKEKKTDNNINARRRRGDGTSSYHKYRYKTVQGGDGKPDEFQCGSCPFSVDALDKLFAHIYHRHREKYLECPVCPTNTNKNTKHNINSFNFHLALYHKDISQETAGKVISGRNGFYIYNKKWSFKKTEDGSFQCWDCDEIVAKSVSASSTITATKASEILEEQPEKNPEVENSTSEEIEKSVIDEEAQETKDKSQQQSDQVSTEAQEERRVIIAPENDEEFKNIVAHMHTNHIAATHFLCEICASVSSSKAVFEQHKITHNQEKPFMCEFCAMSFKSLSHLNRHRPVHTEELPFVCQVNTPKGICGRKFKFKRYLEKHLNSNFHDEGKNFECPHCLEKGIHQKFQQLTSLQRHVKNHLVPREKTKCCPDCNKAFYTNSEVRQHSIRCPVLLALAAKSGAENDSDGNASDDSSSSDAGAEDEETQTNNNTTSVTASTTASVKTQESNLTTAAQNVDLGYNYQLPNNNNNVTEYFVMQNLIQ